MKELHLTDHEAKRLINLLKRLAERHHQTLTDGARGQFSVHGSGGERFIINYYYSNTNKVIHLRETTYNYTLLRINLNDKFHKNANGEKIWGNRINIFSAEEYIEKGDESTHYKAFPLPYETITTTDDFLAIFEEFLHYTKVQNPTYLNLTIQDNLL